MNDKSTTKDPLRFITFSIDILRRVGHNLAAQVLSSSYIFTEYLSPNNNSSSYFFHSVSLGVIEREILSLFLKTRLMVSALDWFGFYPLPNILYLVLSQIYLICFDRKLSFHPNWKKQKLSLSIKAMRRWNQVIIDQYHYSSF